MIDWVLNSNLVALGTTFVVGAALYFPIRRYPPVLTGLVWFFATGIALSFLFGVGEVYRYSYLYNRAFFVFGDGVPTLLALLFVYSMAENRRRLAAVCAGAIFMSGGKMSLILLLLMITGVLLLERDAMRARILSYGKLLGIGLLIYAGMLGVHHGVTSTNFSQLLNFDSGQNAGEYQNAEGAAACATASKCLDTQLASSLQQRIYSSVGGLWMTLQGGYRGDVYPGTTTEFADLMMEEDPWGINERFGLTWHNWKKMGQPQNPYLRFGAGYGPWLLVALLMGLGVLVVMALWVLSKGERGPPATFAVFLIVNVIFNQTQSWLTSGSLVLVAVGFSSMHVLLVFAARQGWVPVWLTFRGSSAAAVLEGRR